jgi:hypothetical protein
LYLRLILQNYKTTDYDLLSSLIFLNWRKRPLVPKYQPAVLNRYHEQFLLLLTWVLFEGIFLKGTSGRLRQ